MIDLASNRAKQIYHATMLHQQYILEKRFEKSFEKIYKSIFKSIARSLKEGEFAYIGAIDAYYDRFSKRLRILYLTTYKHYLALIKNMFDKKSAAKQYYYDEEDVEETIEQAEPDPELYEILNDKISNWAFFFAGRRTLDIFNRMKESTRVKLAETEDIESLYLFISTSAARTSMSRSRTLSKTEVHSASQETIFRYMLLRERVTGIAYDKEWLTMDDDRVRYEYYSHQNAHGEVQRLSNYFTKTGENLLYPGDPLGNVANIVCCRCWMTFRRRRRARA